MFVRVEEFLTDEVLKTLSVGEYIAIWNARVQYKVEQARKTNPKAWGHIIPTDANRYGAENAHVWLLERQFGALSDSYKDRNGYRPWVEMPNTLAEMRALRAHLLS